jgi:EAL domain-containing protein (putative c-di-GMP-specific phosphodiesterase class I)
MNPSLCATSVDSVPYLEHFPEPGGALLQVKLDHFPYQLGRAASADLVIYHPRVSKLHAEIFRDEDEVRIKDLGSTNGTFVNGRRIHACVALVNGDIIHLAEKEFRFAWEPTETAHEMASVEATESAMLTNIRSLIKDSKCLRTLLDKHQVTAFFQPIVTLPDRRVVGYEGLGRGRHDTLPTSPGPLFALAKRVKLAAPLSRAFRKVTLSEAAHLRRPHRLFLNMHPEELPDKALRESLIDLNGTLAPGQRLVLEIHEDLVADISALKRLQDRLREMDIGLAFDDFGVGQSRLTALAQVKVEYVKLDRTLVRSLPSSQPLRELMRTVGQVCAGQGTQVIAEGVETEEEAEVSCELGCTLAQGYLFGRPQPVGELA